MKSIKSEIREIMLLNDKLGENLGVKKIVVRQIPWHDTIRVNDADEKCLHQWDWDENSADHYCEACRTWQEEIAVERDWDTFFAKREVVK